MCNGEDLIPSTIVKKNPLFQNTKNTRAIQLNTPHFKKVYDSRSESFRAVLKIQTFVAAASLQASRAAMAGGLRFSRPAWFHPCVCRLLPRGAPESHLLPRCPSRPPPTRSLGVLAVPILPTRAGSHRQATGGSGSGLNLALPAEVREFSARAAAGGLTHPLVTKSLNPVPGKRQQHTPMAKGEERCSRRPPSRQHPMPT